MAKQGKTKKKKSKSLNTHDAFFKTTFSYPEIARNYIEHFMDKDLVKNIDLDSLVLENASYVTPELEEYFSDLVWQAKYKETNVKISFLFEHKSYVVKYPHVQLLRYILEHVEAQIKAKEPLTVLIPIVIYHGEKEWKVRSFSDYFEVIDEQLLSFIPNFKYHFTNISQYSDEEIISMGIGKLINVFLAMNHVRNVEYILKNYSTIFVNFEKMLGENEVENLFQSIFVYLYKNVEMTEQQIEDIVATVNEPLKNFTMSAYDLLVAKGMEQGIQRGFQNGMEQGIQTGFQNGMETGFQNGMETGFQNGMEKGEYQKARNVIITLFSKFPNWNDSEIAEIANVPVGIVENIRKEIATKN